MSNLPRSVSRSGSVNRRWLGAGLAVVLMVVTGCGGSTTRADLTQALTDTRAAVGGATLALQLLDRGRTTRAATQVTAGDMADQVGLVQQGLADVSADSAEIRQLRQQTQQVVTAAMVTLQDTEDVLAEGGGTGQPTQALREVQGELDAVARQVGGR